VESSVKIVSRLMNLMVAYVGTGIPTRAAQEAFQSGAKCVLGAILRFQKERAGRWPSMSAKALRAAALSDQSSRKFLEDAEVLRSAALQRIEGACERHDETSYGELYSTLALVCTLWGVQNILDTLSKSGSPDLHVQARHLLLQSSCRVIADTEDEELSGCDAAKVVLMLVAISVKQLLLEEVQGDGVERQSIGPLAQALGRALGVIAENDLNFERADEAAQLLLVLVKEMKRPSTRGLLLAAELSWSLRSALAAPGGYVAVALEKAGAAGVAQNMAFALAKQAAEASNNSASEQEREYLTFALTEALEAYGCLVKQNFFAEVIVPLQQYLHVRVIQTSALRAHNNLVDRKLVAHNNETKAGLAAICQKVIARHGAADEAVRSVAERALGLIR